METSELITVPSDWNDRVTPRNALEVGTYGIWIEGLTPGGLYSLHLGEIGAAAKVFANGAYIGQTAALTPAAGGPEISFARPIYSFEAAQGSNLIAIVFYAPRCRPSPTCSEYAWLIWPPSSRSPSFCSLSVIFIRALPENWASH